MNNELLDLYVTQFGEKPFLFVMMTYEHPFYQYMMEKAVLRGEPLTKKELEENAEAFGIQFDIIQPSEEDKANKLRKDRLDKELGED